MNKLPYHRDKSHNDIIFMKKITDKPVGQWQYEILKSTENCSVGG
jgi:hypothetical protein